MLLNIPGCSSVWGASVPSIPYCMYENGRGPAWANSLFEDNAEFGYGMLLAQRQMRDKIERNMKALLELDISDSMRDAFKEWLEYKESGTGSRAASEAVIKEIQEMETKDNVIAQLCDRIIRYRYNPDLKKQGRNHFILDSKEPNRDFRDFIMGRNRYVSLSKEFPDIADILFDMTEKDAREKYEK